MRKLTADRRLWLTAEKDQVVEEGDGLAAFLLAGAGRTIPAADVERLNLVEVDGRIVYPDGPTVEELQAAEKRAQRRALAMIGELEVGATDLLEALGMDEATEELVEAGLAKVVDVEARKVLTFGGGKDSPDDSDRNDEAPPEWPGRTSPKTYLRLYPTGPKAELARAVIAAKDDGADGGS